MDGRIHVLGGGVHIGCSREVRGGGSIRGGGLYGPSECCYLGVCGGGGGGGGFGGEGGGGGGGGEFLQGMWVGWGV